MTGTNDSKIKAYFGGLPGTSKSTCLLSFPGVEQCVFGDGEEDTALNFKNRTDILPAKVFNWWSMLTDPEKEETTLDKTTEQRIDELTELGKYRNICRFKRYLYSVRKDLDMKKRPELLTFGLDNLTPFADEFKAYIMVKYRRDFTTKEGNFDGRKFWPKYSEELSDTVRFMVSLPVNVGITCHVQYSVDEENQQKVMDAKAAPTLPKEWMPNIDGKTRFSLGGLFTYCFFLWAEESPGLPTKYYAKLEADQNNVGLAKGRFQPFSNPRKIELPKNTFYTFLMDNINKKLQAVA